MSVDNKVEFGCFVRFAWHGEKINPVEVEKERERERKGRKNGREKEGGREIERDIYSRAY